VVPEIVKVEVVKLGFGDSALKRPSDASWRPDAANAAWRRFTLWRRCECACASRRLIRGTRSSRL